MLNKLKLHTKLLKTSIKKQTEKIFLPVFFRNFSHLLRIILAQACGLNYFEDQIYWWVTIIWKVSWPRYDTCRYCNLKLKNSFFPSHDYIFQPGFPFVLKITDNESLCFQKHGQLKFHNKIDQSKHGKI